MDVVGFGEWSLSRALLRIWILASTLVIVKIEISYCASNCFAGKICHMERDYYTTEEAAAHLGITVGRVRQMIVDGLLKTERFGRAHMISRGALKVAEQRPTKPGPKPKGNGATTSRKKSKRR